MLGGKKLSECLEGIVDACHVYPQVAAGITAGIATTALFYSLDFQSFDSIGAGVLSAFAGAFAYSSIAVHRAREKFSNLLPKKDMEKELERRIDKFESSNEGKKRGLLVRLKDAVLKYPKTVSALVSIDFFQEHVSYQFLGIPWLVYDKLPHDGGIHGAVSGIIDLYGTGRLDIVLDYYARIIPMEISIFAISWLASKSLRDFFHSAFYGQSKHVMKAVEANILRKHKKAIEACEDANEEGGMNTFHSDIARLYLKDGNMALAFKELSKMTKMERRGFSYTNDCMRMMMINEELVLRNRIKKNPDDLGSCVRLIFHHYNLLNMDDALRLMKDTEASFPGRINVKLLHAMLLESVGDPEADSKWSETVEMILSGSALIGKNKSFRRLSESSNEVLECTIDEFVMGTLVFKRGDRKNLRAEADLAAESQKLVRGFDEYVTVSPLGRFRQGESYEEIYVMRYAEGEKLYFMKDRDIGLFMKVADFLALIHARFPAEKSCKGRIDIPRAVKEKLAYRDLSLPESLIRKVLDNYSPVCDSFKDALYVFNKDANPENWVVRKDRKIVAIDWEDKGLVPMQFDIVNLLEYNGAALKDGQKDEVIKGYIRSYNRYKGSEDITDIDGFRLCYFNAVIQRAISLCSAWSSLDRPTMRAKRAVVLDNALNAMRRLRDEHAGYYGKHRKNYAALEEALGEIKSICSTASTFCSS